MTSSRIVRGTKGRIFVYVVAVILITGIIACYNSTLSQLDDVKKSSEVCRQENENLSTQLQMVSDYKQRLEKSLKSEKAEHQQAKNGLESKINEEKSKCEKATNEAKLQLSSLQQHYNLLQTQLDDFKSECSKNQQEKSSENNNLQSKLQEIQGQLKKLEGEREKLKSEYAELQAAKQNLEERVKGTQGAHLQSETEVSRLVKENNALKSQLEILKRKYNDDTLQAPQPDSGHLKAPDTSTNASKRKQNGDGHQLDANVADQPPADENVGQEGVVNVQNENVLPEPNSDNFKKVSPPGSSVKASSKASLEGARPLKMPTTPGARKSSDNKIPEGVVPVPNKEQSKKSDLDEKIVGDDVKNALPNRYQNNIIENERANEERAEQSDRDLKLKTDIKADEAEKDNGANEVFDLPAIVNEKSKNDARHIDVMGLGPLQKLYDGQDPGDYDKEARDVQQEENEPEEDDDPDDYGGVHIPRQAKESAVRN